MSVIEYSFSDIILQYCLSFLIIVGLHDLDITHVTTLAV